MFIVCLFKAILPIKAHVEVNARKQNTGVQLTLSYWGVCVCSRVCMNTCMCACVLLFLICMCSVCVFAMLCANVV